MIIALDPGFGNVKVVGGAGEVILQSAVSTDGGPLAGRMVGLRAARPPLRISTEAGTFYTGAGAHDWGRPVESLDFDRLTGSPEMAALVYAALTEYSAGADLLHPLDLLVGLPVEALTGQAAAPVKRGVVSWLRGRHQWVVSDAGREFGLSIQVDRVRVTSQPVGALFDWLLDDAGAWIPERRALFRREIGVLGVGMNTVDLLAVRNGQPVQRFIAGRNVGVRRLLRLCDGQQLYSLAELDQQLRAGTLDTAGALDVWQREVAGLIESQWADQWRRFAAVIVVGGGAALLQEPLMRRFGGLAWVPADPVISTARGLYKYGLLKA